MRNIEIKARVKNIGELLQKVKNLSDTSGEIIKQHDSFYSANQGRLKLRRFETGNAEVIYYDRPNIEGPKLSSYEKASIPADSVQDLHAVLSRALNSTTEVRKTRQLFMIGQTRVHVDAVQDLGDFLELEVVLKQEQTPEEGEKIALHILNDLGIEKSQLLSGAYADLLAEKLIK